MASAYQEDGAVTLVPLKRRGRPPVDVVSGVPSADVHLTLPAAEYDDAFRLATHHRVSVQDIIRRGLKRLLSDERSGPSRNLK